MTTTQKAKTLWTDLNGRVACPDHMGCSASYILRERPRARVIETDLTVWERMTADEVAEWLAFVAGHGQTVGCEDCQREVAR